MMLFRCKLLLIAATIWLIPHSVTPTQLFALAEGSKTHDLTFLFVGDEIGYLEPCG